MIVVPLKNDKIETVDGGIFRVVSYTNLKTDPAVYIDAADGENSVVYFQDIVSINGTKVSYHSANKTFEALGTVKRKYNLPQPGDIATVDDTLDNQITVKTVKLHNKKAGVTKGLIFCEGSSCYELASIKSITRIDGSEHFDPQSFKKYYKDYLPISHR